MWVYFIAAVIYAVFIVLIKVYKLGEKKGKKIITASIIAAVIGIALQLVLDFFMSILLFLLEGGNLYSICAVIMNIIDIGIPVAVVFAIAKIYSCKARVVLALSISALFIIISFAFLYMEMDCTKASTEMLDELSEIELEAADKESGIYAVIRSIINFVPTILIVGVHIIQGKDKDSKR